MKGAISSPISLVGNEQQAAMVKRCSQFAPHAITMRILQLVTIALLALPCHGKPLEFRQERRTKGRGTLSIGDLDITYSDDDEAVATPPFLLALFETSGGISDNAIAEAEQAMNSFVLDQLNGWFSSPHEVTEISTAIFSQEYDEYDIRRREMEDLFMKEQIMSEVTRGAADKPIDEQKFLRGRRKLNMPGSLLGMQVNVTFDRMPAPSEEDVDDALKQVMQDLSAYATALSSSGDPELQDVVFAFRREFPEPTEAPTRAPTLQPTLTPTNVPTTSPTETPTDAPTTSPTESPTLAPTASPTDSPSDSPTASPTASPTDSPTGAPTESPSRYPTIPPSYSPTSAPTHTPTLSPTDMPSVSPTDTPTLPPTDEPTVLPTSPPSSPTGTPTVSPTDTALISPTITPTVIIGSGIVSPTNAASPTVPYTPAPTVVVGSGNVSPTNAASPTVLVTPVPTVVSGSGNVSPTNAASPTVPVTPAPTVVSGLPTVPVSTAPTVVSGSGNVLPTNAASPTVPVTPAPTVVSSSGNVSPTNAASPTIPVTPAPTVVSGSGNVSPTNAASPTIPVTPAPTVVSGSDVSPTNAASPTIVETPSPANDVASPTKAATSSPTVADAGAPIATPTEIITVGASPWDPKDTGSDDTGPGDMFDQAGKVVTRTTSPDQDEGTNNTAIIASLVCVGAAMVAFMGFLLYRRRQQDEDSQRGDLLVVESDLDSIDPSTMSPSANNDNLDSVFGGLDSGSLESPHLLAKTKSISSATTIRASNNVLRQTPKSNGGSLFAFSEEESEEEESVEVSTINVSKMDDGSRYTPRNLGGPQDHLVDTGSDGPSVLSAVSPVASELSYSKLMKAEDDDWKPTGIAAMVAGVVSATVGAAAIGSRRRQSDASSSKPEVAEEDGSFPSYTTDNDLTKSRGHAGYQGEGDGTMVYQTAAAAVNPLDLSGTDGSNASELNTGFCGSVCPDSCCKNGENEGTDNTPMSGYDTTPTSRSVVSSLSGSVASKDTAASSQFSASRQLINDLVWLEKKIADVKTTGDMATAIKSDESELNESEMTNDSLSSVAKGIDIPISGEIDCREIRAPPGKLQVVIHSTRDGPAVHEVRNESPLMGQLLPGDLIIAIGNDDTRALGADQVMKMMAERSDSERKITVLRYTGE